MTDPFEAAFGRPATASAKAHGRVNLIGEHIDYAGGLVLPTLIPQALRVRTAPAPQNAIRVRSSLFREIAHRRIDDAYEGHWSDYALAGHRLAARAGFASAGADYLVESDIPHGAGVSSSAALLIAVLMAAARAVGRPLTPEQAAQMAQRAETEELNVPVGIMDQMAIAVGRPGFALALDTWELSWRHIPLPTDHAFAVLHSGVSRALNDGRYAERRRAVETAASRLGVKRLVEVDAAAVIAAGLPNDVTRRARHVVTEHQRSKQAAVALEAQDIALLCILMNESHASMRDDFEIVPDEIDQMTRAALAFGALGSRLTGGGFGGCLVSLVDRARLGRWTKAMLEKFPRSWLLAADVAPRA